LKQRVTGPEELVVAVGIVLQHEFHSSRAGWHHEPGSQQAHEGGYRERAMRDIERRIHPAVMCRSLDWIAMTTSVAFAGILACRKSEVAVDAAGMRIKR
jgi:hypothetical protein